MSEVFCPHCMSLNNETDTFCKVCSADIHSKNSPHALSVNTILKGRYLVGEVIGEGGFGIIYIGLDLVLESKVAIKEFFPSLCVNRDSDGTVIPVADSSGSSYMKSRNAFIKEKDILSSINDRNIVSVIDFFDENGTSYIVMEYIEGVTIREYIEKNGPLNYNTAYSLLRPVMLSLGKIHETGYIHRDISPSNLIVMPSGKLKLIDFGAALPLGEQDGMLQEMIIKPGYTPEEQYRDSKYQGTWTDVYAICATFYMIITGTVPETSTDRIHKDKLLSPSNIGANIPVSFENILMRGLAVEANERPQTMARLVEEFDNPEWYSADKNKKKKIKISLFLILFSLIIAIFLLISLNSRRNNKISDSKAVAPPAQSSSISLPIATTQLCSNAYEAPVYKEMIEMDDFQKQPVFTSNQFDIYAERCFYDKHNILFIVKYDNKTDKYVRANTIRYGATNNRRVTIESDYDYAPNSSGYGSIVINTDLLYTIGTKELSSIELRIKCYAENVEFSDATWEYTVQLPNTIVLDSKFSESGIELSNSTDDFKIVFHGLSVDSGSNFADIALTTLDLTGKEQDYVVLVLKDIYADNQKIYSNNYSSGEYCSDSMILSKDEESLDKLNVSYAFVTTTDEMNRTGIKNNIPNQIRLTLAIYNNDYYIEKITLFELELVFDIDADGYGSIVSCTKK